jgi:hypothetical protein
VGASVAPYEGAAGRGALSVALIDRLYGGARAGHPGRTARSGGAIGPYAGRIGPAA